ncbi:carbohydrate binding family 9 domain-containing protein, partial [candidate division WOR-3 bacterium]|nr:carbohydrate binding family 9 domain-containing protein [candidate division WOR-3 bacterium]
MHLIVALLVAAGPTKTIQVGRAPTPPRLDGVIEDAWLAADSADDFVQHFPDEGAAPSERTVVYVMQDDANLYVAFRAWSLASPPVGQLYGLEDELTLYLDPMDSRQTAYFFKAYASGLWRQGLILDNGGNEDWSWEGIWYVGTRLYEDRIECEMRIPFKSVRWRAGATEWGINFQRAIARKNEFMYWMDNRDEEGGQQVSKYGRLAGIAPRSKGFYFELLPEGYVRLDEDRTGKRKVKPSASLNVKWDLTPQTTLNATALPDFAQIESDPYSFNISRYPTYLSERRPFFVEGSEIFRFSGLGGAGNFGPLNLFYSRRIGKPVGNQPVPILGGLKLTGRGRGWSAGFLSAATDEVVDTVGMTQLEPRRAFTALSGRARLSPLFSGGLLFAGTAADTARH